MLTIGQLARLTRTTPRALRLYERRGLIRPDRTPAGRRVYGREHVAVLAQIRIFKDMGLSLAAIGDLLGRHTLDAAGMIDLRLAQVEAEQARLTVLAANLRRTRAALESGAVDAAALAALLAPPDAQRFRTLIDRWFTPEQQESWRAAAGQVDEAVWIALRKRTRAAMASGVRPDSEEGRAIGAAWQAALQPILQAVGPDLWRRGAAMFRDPASFAADGLAEDMEPVFAWVFAAIPPPVSSASPSGPVASRRGDD